MLVIQNSNRVIASMGAQKIVIVLKSQDNTPIAKKYSLHLLHVNDIHARFEQNNKYSGRCSQKDLGNTIKVCHCFTE